MPAATVERTRAPVWFWRFTCEEDLRSRLEEYTAHMEDASIAKYGERRIGGEESDGDMHMCQVRIRAEIDSSLGELEYPFLVRMLDLYYRHGLSCENKGWCVVARLMGMRGDPKSRWDRDTFERLLELGVGRLWRAHDGRYQRIAVRQEH